MLYCCGTGMNHGVIHYINTNELNEFDDSSIKTLCYMLYTCGCIKYEVVFSFVLMSWLCVFSLFKNS